MAHALDGVPLLGSQAHPQLGGSQLVHGGADEKSLVNALVGEGHVHGLLVVRRLQAFGPAAAHEAIHGARRVHRRHHQLLCQGSDAFGMIRLAEALDDAALVERRARGIAQGALCLGADELDGYERARGRETLSAPSVQWGFDVGCGGNRRFQNGAIRGILGWEGGVQALYQGLVDGSDVLGAVVGDGEEPRAAIGRASLAGRVPMGDEGVDGLGHHIGLHA